MRRPPMSINMMAVTFSFTVIKRPFGQPFPSAVHKASYIGFIRKCEWQQVWIDVQKLPFIFKAVVMEIF